MNTVCVCCRRIRDFHSFTHFDIVSHFAALQHGLHVSFQAKTLKKRMDLMMRLG